MKLASQPILPFWLAPLVALGGCSTPSSDVAVPPDERLAVLDVGDSTSFLAVSAYGPDGSGTADLRFALCGPDGERAVPLFAAQTADGRHHVGIDRGGAEFEGPLWLLADSSRLGRAFARITTETEHVELRFAEPVTLELELEAPEEDGFDALLRPVARLENGNDDVRLCPLGISVTGTQGAFTALQPGLYDLEIERHGTASPWDGKPVVVARHRVSVDDVDVKLALTPRSVSDAVIHVPNRSAGHRLAMRRTDGESSGDEFVVRTASNLRVEISDLPEGTYALRSADGGVEVTMTVPTQGFVFVDPEIAGQRILPRRPGADISPFMEGDILLRFGQGGVDSVDFGATVATSIAMGSETHVAVLRNGERLSFDAGQRVMSVKYVPVSARSIEGGWSPLR